MPVQLMLLLALCLLFPTVTSAETLTVNAVTIRTSPPEGYTDQTANLDKDAIRLFSPDGFRFLRRYTRDDSTDTNELYFHLLINETFSNRTFDAVEAEKLLTEFATIFGREKEKFRIDTEKTNEAIREFGVSMNTPTVLNVTRSDDHVSFVTLTKYSGISDQENWYYSINITEFFYVCDTFLTIYSYNNFRDEDVEKHMRLAMQQADTARAMLLKENGPDSGQTQGETGETAAAGSEKPAGQGGSTDGLLETIGEHPFVTACLVTVLLFIVFLINAKRNADRKIRSYKR